MNAKEQYREQLHAQLLEWQADARKLRALSEKASAEARETMRAHIEELDAKIDEAAGKLLELSNISEDAWETVREGFESAWDALRKAVKDAADRLKA